MIVLVAAFGIISTLIMLVMQKRKEIAILKAMGATSRSVLGIFLVQGLLIGAPKSKAPAGGNRWPRASRSNSWSVPIRRPST